MTWRWDKYVIPLPFTTVTAAAHNYGELNKERIPKLPTSAGCQEMLYDEGIKYDILEEKRKVIGV